MSSLFLSLSLSHTHTHTHSCSFARSRAHARFLAFYNRGMLAVSGFRHTRPALIALFAACSNGCRGHAVDQHSLLYFRIRQRMCTHARRNSRGPRGISIRQRMCTHALSRTSRHINIHYIYIYHLQLAPVLFPTTSAYVSIRPRMCMPARRHYGRTSVAVSSVY